MTKSYKKKSCRLCGCRALSSLYKFKKNPIGDDYKNKVSKEKLYDLELVKCVRCNFVQLSNVIDPKRVYGEYLYVTNTSHGLQKHFYKLGDKLIKNKIVSKKSKVLEIGSNDGTLLKYFFNKSRLVVGVDPAAHLFKDKKIKNLKGLFDFKFSKNLKKRYNSFDVILANNVIANIDDLNDVFKGIKNILSLEGYFVMETFSLNGIVKNNLIDNIYHEHLSYFSIKSFEKFANKFDLYLKDVEFLKVKGGSLRFIFQNKKINKNIRVKNLIKKETKIIKNLSLKFKQLRRVNNKNKNMVKKLIDSCKKEGKTIYGFGASVGSTTLVYDFELNKRINYIFDNEKKRYNLYMPGTKIKVLNPYLIKKMKIDYILIFAWRYAKQILIKNKNLFSKNTKFILPLPKFRIIK